MLGAVIGDIVGSIYEWNNIHTKDFPFFKPFCFATDDSVMTIAVGKALMSYRAQCEESGVDVLSNLDRLRQLTIREMQSFGRSFPGAGYGGRFAFWLTSWNPQPYNSCGNGSAMRVSAAAWFASTMEEAVAFSKAVTEVTHNHPEGIKGAEATTVAIFMGRQGKSLDEILEPLRKNYYPLDRSLDAIRPTYVFNEICQTTVPEALEAFFEGCSFEDAVRNAISLGGDSDTLAAITGSCAEAYWGIPEKIQKEALDFLPPDLRQTLLECRRHFVPIKQPN